MEDFKVLSVERYQVPKKGVSMFSYDDVEITGEQVVELEDGRVIEQYLYNIVGYTPKNGKEFVSLKANIMIM